MDILIVDGYNIIGAWPELNVLKNRDLAAARDTLVAKMAEYQGYSGYRVIVVFDAYYVKGTEKKYKDYKVEVIFTRENETADERIEKLAIELNNRKTQIHVATSDFTEQWAIFGQGALRKSARELLLEMAGMEQEIGKKVKKIKEKSRLQRFRFQEKWKKFSKNGAVEKNELLTLKKRLEYNGFIHDCTVGGICMSTDNWTKSNEYIGNYMELEDEVLVELVHQGESDALDYLIQKYRNFVRAKARSYFLIGADKEDIVQEGMIGLYKAIRDFKEDKLSSFKAFAELCITRQIITAIKTATRQKHIPLNSYVSLDKPIYDEESDRTLMDIISGAKVLDPEELIINQEEYDHIEIKMSELLSDLERKVLSLYLDGQSYQEISEELNRHVKSIDNALQRVKRKLERYLEIREFSL